MLLSVELFFLLFNVNVDLLHFFNDLEKPEPDLCLIRKDIDAVMRAFDAYIPNKMNHYPLTFIRVPGNDKWVRIYGMIGTADLMAE